MNSNELIKQSVENIERLINRASNADLIISNNSFDALQRARKELLSVSEEVAAE